jgi:hypothetical protein
MENNEYEFLTTIFEKEKLRIAVLSLSKYDIKFHVIDKTNYHSSKAPLSIYVEADILIHVSDYERAAELLNMLDS